jgi:purine-nucleoside/S-methyl-5'-thioadenosine phosphorylase / adenosine deaminase
MRAVPRDGELAFELPGAGHALFTARAHGNMSSVAGLGHEHGHDARESLRARLGLQSLARGHQVHGRTVPRVRAAGDIQAPDPPDAQPPVRADGYATSLPGIGVIALAADCLPVALGADGAVAIVHAGWRGLEAGVLEEGLRAVRELGGEGEIVAVIGPGAGGCCYEVGPEVHAALRPPGAGARQRIDLPAIARERLRAAQVSDVLDVGVCTICDERFYSHRREGSRAGRQAGVAWLSRSR